MVRRRQTDQKGVDDDTRVYSWPGKLTLYVRETEDVFWLSDAPTTRGWDRRPHLWLFDMRSLLFGGARSQVGWWSRQGDTDPRGGVHVSTLGWFRFGCFWSVWKRCDVKFFLPVPLDLWGVVSFPVKPDLDRPRGFVWRFNLSPVTQVSGRNRGCVWVPNCFPICHNHLVSPIFGQDDVDTPQLDVISLTFLTKIVVNVKSSTCRNEWWPVVCTWRYTGYRLLPGPVPLSSCQWQSWFDTRLCPVCGRLGPTGRMSSSRIGMEWQHRRWDKRPPLRVFCFVCCRRWTCLGASHHSGRGRRCKTRCHGEHSIQVWSSCLICRTWGFDTPPELCLSSMFSRFSRTLRRSLFGVSQSWSWSCWSHEREFVLVFVDHYRYQLIVYQTLLYSYFWVFTHELYRGGVITSQWPGMWGQEWDIEASFRLRIMDYLPNRLLSLWIALFLTWGTHTYICCNSCLILNTKPTHRETKKSRYPMFLSLQFRPIQIPSPKLKSPSASISETPRECLQRPLSTV